MSAYDTENNRYDCIVVGAGNGGLAAAAETSKNGLRTLLLEKHNLPGGCAGSFVRGRFEFETSLHELCCVGTKERPGAVYSMFSDLGENIDWRYDDNLYRAILKGPDGYDVTIRGGREGFLDSIEEAVPGARKSVESLLDLASGNEETLKYLERKNNKPNKLSMLLKHRNFLKSSSHTLSEIEDALGIPPKAKSIIETYWSYLGVIPDDVNAMHFLSMLNGYIDSGAAMPAMRSHELSLALADSIAKNGGEIRLNSPVSRFLTDKEKNVIGVETGSKKFFASEVISNIMPDAVYSMMDRSSVPGRDLKLLNARELAVSAYTIYLGLDCSAEELGVTDYTVFVAECADPRVQLSSRGLYTVNCLNMVIPDCSPEGTCMLFFTAIDYGNNLPSSLKGENYKRFKESVAEKYIRDYEELTGMDIVSHIEEIEVATPVTFARYLGTPDGTIYGYKLSKWDNILSRVLNAKKENAIPGLSFVGGHSTRGDGYSSAYASGLEAAGRIVSKLKGGRR